MTPAKAGIAMRANVTSGFSCNFNKTVPAFQGSLDLRQQWKQRRNQLRVSAIAYPKPNDGRPGTSRQNPLSEVFVLGQDGCALLAGVKPKIVVRTPGEI
jgi:hypothetical protein